MAGTDAAEADEEARVEVREDDEDDDEDDEEVVEDADVVVFDVSDVDELPYCLVMFEKSAMLTDEVP